LVGTATVSGRRARTGGWFSEGWVLLVGHEWIPRTGHTRVLFHGHGHPPSRALAGVRVPSFQVHPGPPIDIAGGEAKTASPHRRRTTPGRRRSATRPNRSGPGHSFCSRRPSVWLSSRSQAGRQCSRQERRPPCHLDLGLLLTTLGLLGTASVIVARKEFGSIDAAVMTSTYQPPVLPKLAAGYSRQVGTERTRWRPCSLRIGMPCFW